MLHRGFDLDPHGVTRIVKSRGLSVRVLAHQCWPMTATITSRPINRLLDPVVRKLTPVRNTVDVEEHGVLAVLRDQVVGGDAAGHVLGVGTTV